MKKCTQCGVCAKGRRDGKTFYCSKCWKEYDQASQQQQRTNGEPVELVRHPEKYLSVTQRPSSGLESHASSHVHELNDYPTIDEHLRRQYSLPTPRLWGKASATRHLPLNAECAKIAIKTLAKEFAEIHCKSNNYADGKTHTCFDQRHATIECDYFAYCDGAVENEPVPQSFQEYSSFRKSFSSRHSDDDDLSRTNAVIFEITSQQSNFAYKVAQLELRLAYYRAFRETRKKTFLEHIAACGVVVHPADVEFAKALSAYPVFVHIRMMGAKFAILPSRAACNSGEGPATFWARLLCAEEEATKPSKAVAFQVTPVILNIDGLKKAVKAEMQLTMPAPLLKVYAHDAVTGGWVEVTKASTPLAPNTEETAYHVVVGS